MSNILPIQRWIGAPFPTPLPGSQGPSARSGALSVADKGRIQDETRAEIVLAFTAFTDACTANITAMRAAAKAEAEFKAMLIDVATGFLAPAFATYMASKFLSKATGLSDQVSKDVVTSLISRNDLLKASFTGATKTVSSELKIHATHLFGEEADDAFLDLLKKEFQKNAVQLAGSVGTMHDHELVATWVAYDAEAANAITYKSTINDLLKEFHDIQELGIHKFFGEDVQDVNHLVIKIEGLGYAIAFRDMSTLLYPAGPYEFDRPIDDYFVDAAIRRAKDKGQKNFPTLKTSEVKDVPAGVKQWGTHK